MTPATYVNNYRDTVGAAWIEVMAEVLAIERERERERERDRKTSIECLVLLKGTYS